MSRLFHFWCCFAGMLCYGLLPAQTGNTPGEGKAVLKSLNYAIEKKNVRFWEPPYLFGKEGDKNRYVTWIEYNTGKVRDEKDSAFVYFSASGNGGETWQASKRIGSYIHTDPDSITAIKGAKGCTNPQGKIYITWLGPKGIVFQASEDSGKTWLREEKIVSSVKKVWNQSVNGSLCNGLPCLCSGPGKEGAPERIYICWGDEKYGAKNKDVLLVYSDDGGGNWTEPILVTYRPNQKAQFKPAMTVDPGDGRLYLIYFDQQNHQDTNVTDLYVAVSDNGGLLFETCQLNKQPIPINAGLRLENGLRLIAPHHVEASWTCAAENGKTESATLLITDSLLEACKKAKDNDPIKIEKTFAWADPIKILFECDQALYLGAAITKPLDPGFEKELFKGRAFAAGPQSFLIHPAQLGLAKGNYILTLYYKGRNSYVWLLKE